MFKAMIMLTRRADLTHEEFASWWLRDHAPLARQLPEVREIRFNLVDQVDDPPCDGITELWFDSADAFAAAYASELGQRVAADSLSMVSSRVRMPVVEHRVT